MTDVPVVVQIIVLFLSGVFLLGLLWFAIAVLREVIHRLRVRLWASEHPDEVVRERSREP